MFGMPEISLKDGYVMDLFIFFIKRQLVLLRISYVSQVNVPCHMLESDTSLSQEAPRLDLVHSKLCLV